MSELEAEWRRKTDEQVLDAVVCLEDYTADAQRVIQAEVSCRGIVAPPDRSMACGEANATTAPRPTDVGGWLALLTYGLLILGPILGLVGITEDFRLAEAENAAVRTVGPWANFKAATWVTYLGFAVVSVYAGWGLLQGRDWSVVRRAQIALWTIGPVAHVVMALVVPLVTLSAMPGFDVDQLVMPFIGGFTIKIAVAALWTMYLSTSQRVRSTYGVAERGDDVSSTAA